MPKRRDLTDLQYTAVRVADIVKKMTVDEAMFLSKIESLLDPYCGMYEVYEMFQYVQNDLQALDVLKDISPEDF
jgi:hypothetical protein